MAYYPVIKKKRNKPSSHEKTWRNFILFIYLFIYFIVVGFVIHWNESAMGLMKEL